MKMCVSPLIIQRSHLFSGSIRSWKDSGVHVHEVEKIIVATSGVRGAKILGVSCGSVVGAAAVVPSEGLSVNKGKINIITR